MSEKRYFVLTSSEDGIDVSAYNTAALKRYLAERIREGYPPTFLSEIPDSDKKGCWYAVDNAVLLILGEIIQPTPKQVVKEWELP